jgi:hypothetical protein
MSNWAIIIRFPINFEASIESVMMVEIVSVPHEHPTPY